MGLVASIGLLPSFRGDPLASQDYQEDGDGNRQREKEMTTDGRTGDGDGGGGQDGKKRKKRLMAAWNTDDRPVGEGGASGRKQQRRGCRAGHSRGMWEEEKCVHVLRKRAIEGQ